MNRVDVLGMRGDTPGNQPEPLIELDAFSTNEHIIPSLSFSGVSFSIGSFSPSQGGGSGGAAGTFTGITLSGSQATGLVMLMPELVYTDVEDLTTEELEKLEEIAG